MSSGVHSLLRASAGTGKTYRLSSRFLELMFQGVDPARVLATTFTRKAAGEILDRVLERLVDAAQDDKELAKLNLSLNAVQVTRADCEAKLADLTRRIDRFKIRTLDSFFVHLAQLYSLDLGMTPGWTILDESADSVLREEALSRLIAESERDEIIDLLRSLSATAATRSIRSVLDSAVKDGRNAFLESRKEAWSCFDPGSTASESKVAAMAAALEACPIPETKAGTPVKHWANAIPKLLALFRDGDWKALLAEGLIKNFLAGKDFSRHPVDADVFQPIIDHAQQQCLADLARKNQALYIFLERFEAHYDALKAAHAGYRFEDVPARIAPLGSNGFEQLSERELEMWFRLDSKIDHLLLDEFQDTAPVQWRILGHLADEILALGTGEQSLFVVGDVKQSIYSWREAEPRLFANLEKRFEALRGDPPRDEYSIEHLSQSYRSSRIVLETVNRVFGQIGESPVFDEGPRAEAAAEWNKYFDEHSAAIDRPGCAFLLQAPEGEHGDAEEQVLRLAMDRIAAISAEAPHCTIGILLRRNKYISKCINLLRERGIRASGEGGNKLTDSAAVQQLLSALHLADHPDDTLAAFHVVHSPLGPALDFEHDEDDSERRAVARKMRAALVEQGYGAFLSGLAAKADPKAYSAWDRRRLAQLVDMAFAYDAEAGLRPGAFVKFVREKSVEDPSSARVKVMTIHASKGLEFDVVVLPELNGRPFMPSAVVSARDPQDLTAPLTGVSTNASENLMQSNPQLKALWRAHETSATHEFLSLLYVAMTRAVHRLEMIVQAPPKSSTSLTAARILRDTLGAGDPDEQGVVWAHPENDAAWFVEDETSSSTPTEPKAREFKLLAGGRDLARASASAHDGGLVRTGAQLLRPRPQRAATRGLLFHRWFEEIEWLEEFETSDEALQQLGLKIERDEGVVRQALADFRAALTVPSLRTLLTRGKREVQAVWRERDFSLILPDDNGRDTIWNGTFDRVVLSSDRVELIDFKTDEITPEQANERARSHAPQLAAYERVLSAMLAPSKCAIEKKLAFVHPGLTITLE